MIDAIEKNLQRGIKLLNTISDAQYSNQTVAPYFSSIGSNIRHVLDVYTCIFNGLESKLIDFSDRERNQICEEKTAAGITYFNSTLEKLQALDASDFSCVLLVTDDLGSGKMTATQTLGSVLLQAHSHAIHHYASIGFIIYQLEIELPDVDFGYNPTTPKKAFDS
jgi:uncharacterized damage-inducible protein DinB